MVRGVARDKKFWGGPYNMINRSQPRRTESTRSGSIWKVKVDYTLSGTYVRFCMEERSVLIETKSTVFLLIRKILIIQLYMVNI